MSTAIYCLEYFQRFTPEDKPLEQMSDSGRYLSVKS